MPKVPMTQETIENTRGRILDTALQIIIEEGFDHLSIRKIATRLGVTATTIYNYYTNKDELNLMIRIRGFEKLHDLLTERAGGAPGLVERVSAMIGGYIDFGLSHPSYYDIMFNLKTPKYLDYVGTDMEPLAHHEKQVALKCMALFVEAINDYIPGKSDQKEAFVRFEFVRFWSDLHGLITLSNSRLFHEVIEDVSAFIEKRKHALISELLLIKDRLDRGEMLF